MLGVRSQAQRARKPPAGLKPAGGWLCDTGGPTRVSAPTFYLCLELGTLYPFGPLHFLKEDLEILSAALIPINKISLHLNCS